MYVFLALDIIYCLYLFTCKHVMQIRWCRMKEELCSIYSAASYLSKIPFQKLPSTCYLALKKSRLKLIQLKTFCERLQKNNKDRCLVLLIVKGIPFASVFFFLEASNRYKDPMRKWLPI